jgi:hypothetical protein
MAAPLVVRSAVDLRADVQEVTVLLHDFTFRDPAETLAKLTGDSGMAHGGHGMSMPGMSGAHDGHGTAAGGVPMHLHGHTFQVVSLNGVPMTDAVRDTVLVPANGSVTVAFDADNPGAGRCIAITCCTWRPG